MGIICGVFRWSAVHRDGQQSHGAKQYKGLKNQGATCYLNTVLQCLYMTKDFRIAVQRFKPGPQGSRLGNAGLLLQLQNLFEKLNKEDGTTKEITQSLCIKNVYEQQDAVEYYKKILKTVGPQVSQVFEGKMSNKSKCLNEHIYEEKCPFLTIPLAIENGQDGVYSVNNGLEAFFKPAQLDEDNWLYCDQCDRKIETVVWNEIEEFPTVLTLHLKRFYFDYKQMKHIKDHCPIAIPQTLQFKDCEYDLYAVINHRGDRNGGHYDAAIKSFEDHQWYSFDDISVTKYSVNSLKRSQLAYLLMYRKTQRQSGFALSRHLNFTALSQMTRRKRFIVPGFFVCLVLIMWGIFRHRFPKAAFPKLCIISW